MSTYRDRRPCIFKRSQPRLTLVMPRPNWRLSNGYIALLMLYTVKPVLSGHSKIGFQYQLLLNADQKYCRMLSFCNTLTFIKLPFSTKTFVLSIFKWPLKTDFTVNVIFIISEWSSKFFMCE